MNARFLPALAGLVWLVTVTAGLGALLMYENTPGQAAGTSVLWPQASSVERAPDQDTLILVAHPQCPCTRATVGELNALMSDCQGKLAVHVLFLKPRKFPKDWEKTGLWFSAAAIPGVQVSSDVDGQEAHRFHAVTSGQALLFDPAGHLLFSGGITSARGHSGENAGRDAIVSLVTTGKSELIQTPVFGCSLLTPGGERK